MLGLNLGLNQFGPSGDPFARLVAGGSSPRDPGAGGGISAVQGFKHLFHDADLHTYQGPWTLTIAQGLAVYPGPADDASAILVAVTPEGVAVTDVTVTATGLPNPLPPPFDQGFAPLTVTGFVDGVRRGIVLTPALEDGGAAAEAATSQAILAADTDLSAGPALVSLNPPSSILAHGSDGVIHVLLSGQDADGEPLDFSGMTAMMAVTRTVPTDADFSAADLRVRTAAPAGTYARMAVGASTGRTLAAAPYGVYVRLTAGGQTVTRRAPGLLTVTS